MMRDALIPHVPHGFRNVCTYVQALLTKSFHTPVKIVYHRAEPQILGRETATAVPTVSR